jgi:hypothetical protein
LNSRGKLTPDSLAYVENRYLELKALKRHDFRKTISNELLIEEGYMWLKTSIKTMSTISGQTRSGLNFISLAAADSTLASSLRSSGALPRGSLFSGFGRSSLFTVFLCFNDCCYHSFGNA